MKSLLIDHFIVLGLLASLAMASHTSGECVAGTDLHPFGRCKIGLGTVFECINKCGNQPPTGANAIRTDQCDPYYGQCKAANPGTNKGYCVKDEGDTHPHCQNRKVNERLLTPTCPNGYWGLCDVNHRYGCNGDEIIINPSMPTALTVGGQPVTTWLTKAEPNTALVNASCPLRATDLNCQLIRPFSLGGWYLHNNGGILTSDNYFATITPGTDGYMITLNPVPEWNCISKINAICAKQFAPYGFYRWNGNEFNPTVAGCECSTLNWDTTFVTTYSKEDRQGMVTLASITSTTFKFANSACTHNVNPTMYLAAATNGMPYSKNVTLVGNDLVMNTNIAPYTETFYIRYTSMCCNVYSTLFTVTNECTAKLTKIDGVSKIFSFAANETGTITAATIDGYWFNNSTCSVEDKRLFINAEGTTAYDNTNTVFNVYYQGNDAGANIALRYDIVVRPANPHTWEEIFPGYKISVKGTMQTKHIYIERCGLETWTISTPKTHVLKVGDASVTYTHSQIMTLNTVGKTIVAHPNTGCTVKGYYLCLDNACAAGYPGTNPRITSSGLEITTTTPMSTATLYMVGVSTGYKTAFLPITVTVCGLETLTPTISTYLMTPTPCDGCSTYDLLDTATLMNWFTNSDASNCPISNFVIYGKGTTITPPTNLAQVVPGSSGPEVRVYHNNGGRYQIQVHAVSAGGYKISGSSIIVDIKFCENILVTPAAANQHKTFNTATGNYSVQVSPWFTPVAKVKCPITYAIKTAAGEAVTTSLSLDASNFLQVSQLTPFALKEYKIVASDPWGDTQSNNFFLEVCGTQTITGSNVVQDYVLQKGQDGGSTTLTSSQLSSLFSLTHISLTSNCTFKSAELKACENCGTSFTNSKVSMIPAGGLAMPDIKIDTTAGFNQIQFWLRYNLENGVVFGETKFQVEVCGDEQLVCAPYTTKTYMLDTTANPTWTPQFIHSFFTLTNQGVKCGFTSFALFDDNAATVPWTNPLVAQDPNSVAYQFANGYIIDVSARNNIQFFIKAVTRGLVSCTAKFEVEVCNMVVNSTTNEYILMKNSYGGGLFQDLSVLYETPETRLCNFKSFMIMQDIEGTFYPYTEAFRVFIPTISTDVTVSQSNFTIITMVPFSKQLAPAKVTFQLEDSFSRMYYKNISLLICGQETVLSDDVELIFNFKYGEVNENNVTQKYIKKFKSHFSTNIAQCPVVQWRLVNSTDKSEWTQPEVILDSNLDQLNISTAVNQHLSLELQALTNSSRLGYKTVRIDICGAQLVTKTNTQVVNYTLNMVPGNKTSLVKQGNLTQGIDFTEWFQNSDPDCIWTNFTLTKFDNATQTYVPYTNDLIEIDLVKRDIFVKTDNFLQTQFWLNATTAGGPWQAQAFDVFVCGSEIVSTTGGNSKVKIRYEEDEVANFTATRILGSFSSSNPKCPIVSYNLLKQQGDQSSKTLDAGIVSLTSDEEPAVTIDFIQAFSKYEKLQTFMIQGCSFAKVCAEIEVTLDKITCDESALVSDGVPIVQKVVPDSDATISSSAFSESFLSSNPKCPVTSYGLLWAAGDDEPKQNLDGAISISSSGEITINSAAIMSKKVTTLTFQIVGITQVRKKAFKPVNLDITLPEPEVVEEKEETVVEPPPPPPPPTPEEEKPQEQVVKENPPPAQNPKKVVPGVFLFSPDWAPKPRPVRPPQNFSIEEVEEWKPPIPPSLRNINVDSKGVAEMIFSDSMEYPQTWIEKFNEDELLRSNQTTPEERRRLRKLRPKSSSKSFLDLIIEGATNGEKEDIPLENIEILELSERKIKFKIKFENPALISMSDQSINDRLLIGFNKPLFGTNGQLLNTANLEANEKGIPEPKFDIQPMVDEESEEQQALDGASSGVFNLGLILMLVQFIVTWIASTKLAFFWDLINSQVNYCYLPLLSVNPPGQISFYLDILIFIVTFDPVPMDIIYEVAPVWHFDVVEEANDTNGLFSRIGIEDRNILGVLGSLFLFMTMFVVSQVLFQLLHICKKYSPRVRRILEFLKIETAYRTIMIIFFTETYIDLLLGGLVGSENFHLFMDPENWGTKGNLTMSDQFSIVLCLFIYTACMVFPWGVIILLNQAYDMRFWPHHKKHHFNIFYEFLYDGLKTNVTGLYQYFSVFLVRKFLYSLLVYYYNESVYCMFQVMCNVMLSFFFLLYLAVFQPFISRQAFVINMVNEFSFYLTSLIYITFTDFNPNAYAKVLMGWILIVILLVNLIFPNGYNMVKGIWPDIKALFEKEKPENTQKHIHRVMETYRSTLIIRNKSKLKLRPEFLPKEEFDMNAPLPKGNQVVPDNFYSFIENQENFFNHRQDRKDSQRKIKKMFELEKVQKVTEANVEKMVNLSKIIELSQEESEQDAIEDLMKEEIKQVGHIK